MDRHIRKLYLMVVFLWLVLSAHLWWHAHAAELRYVTAYNVGVKSQTDDTPCIDASNSDICKAVAAGEKRCAANWVPLGTVIIIEGYGECTVTDRMNRRYPTRVDIAFPTDQVAEAKKFGVKLLNVEVK